MSLDAVRSELVEREPLYGGSDGERFVVVDAVTGVEIRTFRDRARAEALLDELRRDGLPAWQRRNLDEIRSSSGTDGSPLEDGRT